MERSMLGLKNGFMLEPMSIQLSLQYTLHTGKHSIMQVSLAGSRVSRLDVEITVVLYAQEGLRI